MPRLSLKRDKMNNMKGFRLSSPKNTFLLLIILLLVISCSLNKNPYQNDAQAISEGRALYMKHCANCHGEDARGGVCPDLTGRSGWRYGNSDSALFKSIAKGRKGGMSAFKNILGKDDIWKIVSYIRSIEQK